MSPTTGCGEQGFVGEFQHSPQSSTQTSAQAANLTVKNTLQQWTCTRLSINVDVQLLSKGKKEPLVDRVGRALEPYLEVRRCGFAVMTAVIHSRFFPQAIRRARVAVNGSLVTESNAESVGDGAKTVRS